MADSVRGIGYHLAVRGAVEGWDGLAAASEKLAESVEYYFWSALVRSHDPRLGEGGGFFNHVSLLASVLCFGLAYGKNELATPAGHLLLRVATSPRLMDPRQWQSRCFESFALQLWARETGGSLPPAIRRQDIGVYADLLSRQPSEDALRKACDFHCLKMEDRGPGRLQEFANPPFDLLPVEIVAVLETNRRSGLELAQPNHSLLRSPLVTLPIASTVYPESQELEMVRDYYTALEVGV